MSRTGIVAVAAKSGREIYKSAVEAREALGLQANGRIALPFQSLLEFGLRKAYGVELDVLDDSSPELAQAYAAYCFSESSLKIRRSIYTRLSLEEPEACFTICHEIGHVHMHSNPVLFRRVESGKMPSRIFDPEIQADRFAREFMFCRTFIDKKEFNSESLARYFRMPLQQVKILLSELRQEGVMPMPAKMDGNSYWEAQQADLDF